jgi:hypothetical protein
MLLLVVLMPLTTLVECLRVMLVLRTTWTSLMGIVFMGMVTLNLGMKMLSMNKL